MKIILIILSTLFSSLIFCQNTDKDKIEKLLKFYPKIKEIKDNKVYFKDGSTLVYDDGKVKNKRELIENPDVEDQFYYIYANDKIGINDAGRIRNEEFFKKNYGNSKKEVEMNLTEIIWCPKLINQKIKVTKINGIDKIFKQLSAELDQHPEFKIYLQNVAGTFNWRKIAGTNRLSMHSFGMTIDINTQFSNYWQWDCKCTDESKQLKYRNRIPKELVRIFEKYGFIWGGTWYHYDTMHFEYRPELL